MMQSRRQPEWQQPAQVWTWQPAAVWVLVEELLLSGRSSDLWGQIGSRPR